MKGWLAMLLLVFFSVSPSPAAEKVSFSRDVAPVLLQKCQACHGARKAKGALRVDSFARLLVGGDGGEAIAPGKPDDSPLYELIASADADERMPKDSDPLSKQQIALVRRWIEEGAKFDGDDPKASLFSVVPRGVHPQPPKKYRAPLSVMAVAISPDGKTLAVGGYHEVTLWSPKTGKLLRRISGVGQRVYSLAYHPKGSQLAVGSGTPGEYGELRTIDLKSGKAPRVYGMTEDVVLAVAFSHDGKLVALGSADRSLHVYEVKTGRRTVAVKQNSDWVTGVAFDRTGALIAGSSRDHTIKAFDTKTGQLRTTYLGHVGHRVNDVAFDPDSNNALSAGEGDRVHVWDPAVIAANDGTAALTEDRFKKALKAQHVTGLGSTVLKINVAAGQLLTASVDGQVRQYDVKTKKLVRTYAGHDDWVYALDYHAAGNLLVTGDFRGQVRVWNAADGKLIKQFTAAPGLGHRK